VRLLMFHVNMFWYHPFDANLDVSENQGASFRESILVWIHSEESDMDDTMGVLRKMVKNIRWMCNKVECSNVILHSFAHLGESKAESDIANNLISETAIRLKKRGHMVHVVPFGQFNEFKMHVNGPSLAKVFKQF
jgi:hypothetical protein